MLTKLNRLSRDKEIKDLIKTGKTLFLPKFTIKHKENKEKTTKIGIIVSTKVDKKAVIRNKIKRQIRAIVKDNINNIKPGYNILIIVKKQALELDFNKLKKTLISGLSKINILNNA